MAAHNDAIANEILIRALGNRATVAEAAKAAGVSERTVYYRMKLPAVRDRVTEIRAGNLSVASGKLTNTMLNACDALDQLVGADNPHVRLKACKMAIDLALKVHGEVDLEQRLNRVERVMAGHDPENPGPDPDADDTDPDDGGGPPGDQTPPGQPSPGRSPLPRLQATATESLQLTARS